MWASSHNFKMEIGEDLIKSNTCKELRINPLEKDLNKCWLFLSSWSSELSQTEHIFFILIYRSWVQRGNSSLSIHFQGFLQVWAPSPLFCHPINTYIIWYSATFPNFFLIEDILKWKELILKLEFDKKKKTNYVHKIHCTLKSHLVV